MNVRFDDNPALLGARLMEHRAVLREAIQKAVNTIMGQNDAQKPQDAPKDAKRATDTPKQPTTQQAANQPQRGPYAQQVRTGNAAPSGQRSKPQ